MGNAARIKLKETNKFGNIPNDNWSGPMMEQLMFRLSWPIAICANFDPEKFKASGEYI